MTLSGISVQILDCIITGRWLKMQHLAAQSPVVAKVMDFHSLSACTSSFHK